MVKTKCVVWDLDHTLWRGVLSEGDSLELDQNAVRVIKELDTRGILNSICSKNDYDLVKLKLEELDLWEYFIYPQINWGPKSDSIKKIAESINIGIDSLAFVDDQQFELDEVKFAVPEVLCIKASEIGSILQMEQMIPHFSTPESSQRRKIYQRDIQRKNAEEAFEGNNEDFLRTLNMRLTISSAEEADLQRAEELTVRTHQLNSTGYTYSYDELKEFIRSGNYGLYVLQLEDVYGDYGKIGLILLERTQEYLELKLFLMSCRVMSKGIGNIVLNQIINNARNNKIGLRALFVPTERNRSMYITYRFNGFKELSHENGLVTFVADTSYERVVPDYVKLINGDVIK